MISELVSELVSELIPKLIGDPDGCPLTVAPLVLFLSIFAAESMLLALAVLIPVSIGI